MKRYMMFLMLSLLAGCAQKTASKGEAFSGGSDIANCGGVILIVVEHDDEAVVYRFKGLSQLRPMSDVHLGHFHRRPDCDEKETP